MNPMMMMKMMNTSSSQNGSNHLRFLPIFALDSRPKHQNNQILMQYDHQNLSFRVIKMLLVSWDQWELFLVLGHKKCRIFFFLSR